MSQAGAITGLAVRELWISFRLLAILVVLVGAGAVVALLPTTVAASLERLSLGLAIGAAVAGAMAAWSMAIERTTGRAGWLVGRSVSRWTLLVSWFVAVGGVTVVGVAIASALGGLTIAGVATRPDLPGFVALGGAVAAWTLVAVALGLLLGALLPAPAAAVVTALACMAAGLVAWVGPWTAPELGWLVPAAGVGLMSSAADVARGIGPALRAAGLGLASVGVLLVLARVALDRADL